MRNHKRLFVLGLALMMVFSFAAMSAAAEEPKFDVYKNIVDFAVVKAVVDGKTKGVIIDARPKRTKYDKGHIPGSLSQSWSKFKSGKVNVMPKDKGTLVIFFCGGLKCPLSHKSAFKAEKMGYTNLAVYAAGMPDWKKNGGKVEKPAKKSSKAGAAGAMAVKPGKGEGTIDVAYFQEVVAKTPEKIYIVDTRDPGRVQVRPLQVLGEHSLRRRQGGGQAESPEDGQARGVRLLHRRPLRRALLHAHRRCEPWGQGKGLFFGRHHRLQKGRLLHHQSQLAAYSCRSSGPGSLQLQE